MRNLPIRYQKLGDPLGSGQFGWVHKCVDVDSGKLMVVKILSRHPDRSEEARRAELRYALKREVEIIAKIKHVIKTAVFIYSGTNVISAAYCRLCQVARLG